MKRGQGSVFFPGDEGEGSGEALTSATGFTAHDFRRKEKKELGGEGTQCQHAKASIFNSTSELRVP